MSLIKTGLIEIQICPLPIEEIIKPAPVWRFTLSINPRFCNLGHGGSLYFPTGVGFTNLGHGGSLYFQSGAVSYNLGLGESTIR